MHGKGHQAVAAVRIEVRDGLHEADVALLNEVRVGKAVAEIAARDGDDETQVADDELLQRFAVVARVNGERQRMLFFGRKHGRRFGKAKIGFEVADSHQRGWLRGPIGHDGAARRLFRRGEKRSLSDWRCGEKRRGVLCLLAHAFGKKKSRTLCYHHSQWTERQAPRAEKAAMSPPAKAEKATKYAHQGVGGRARRRGVS